VGKLTGLSGERADLTAHLPLFGGEPEPKPEPVDPDVRLAWARRALLLSNLDSFTAETVREFTEQMRPELIGAGLWLGFTFRHPWFAVVGHEHARREEAKDRYIIRYTLTAEGREARRNLTSEASNGNN